MPSLRIPESYRPALALLGALGQDIRASIAEALEAAPPFYAAGQLAAWLAGRVPSIDSDQAASIIQVLTSLYAVRIHLNLAVDEVVEDLAAAMQESDGEELELTDSQSEIFRSDLLKLLSIDSMIINEKASNVLSETERVFHSARMLTDIRAVFGEDPTKDPKAAQILHTLRLQYHDYDGIKETFISMDINDIFTLQEVLDRAVLKGRSLGRLLDAAQVPHPVMDLEVSDG